MQTTTNRMRQPGFQFCAILNNQGVSNLLNGNHEEAVLVFTKALRLARRVLVSDHPPHKEPSTRTHFDEETHECDIVKIQGPAHEPLVHSNEDGNHSFVYSSPLLISETADAGAYEAAVKLSVSIMFNLALSHHLNGVGDQAFDPSVLAHAVALYELAYQLQMQEDVEVSVETTMAIINNLGHIHRSLDNQEKAAQCFHHLLATMLFVQSLGDCDASCMADGFFQNVSHLILKKAGAPAA